MILRHEETGRQALYLGRREWAYVPGLSLEASEALLDELWSYAIRPDAIFRQQWRPGGSDYLGQSPGSTPPR